MLVIYYTMIELIFLLIVIGDIYNQKALDSYDVSIVPLLSSKEPGVKVKLICMYDYQVPTYQLSLILQDCPVF